MSNPIEHIESNVRGYSRLFPAVFDTAIGSQLFDASGNRFIDFFCGAGTLNYGHNHPGAKQALLDYISRNGIQHSLDTVTTAKVKFLDSFERLILKPRDLDYVVQFTGPTGTNAVEAAIKLARKQTQRSHVVAFTNAYHGHSLGSLALTGNRYFHSEYYGSRNNVTHLPFDGYMGDTDTSELFAKMLSDGSSGLPIPAAVILETVQGEGGINVASEAWLKRIADICHKHQIMLIIDDIQVGNGRTGAFFSFEASGIKPDVVCLSKSIGGGLPMSLVLIRRDRDTWNPGEHTGTFRGNNLAFVAADAVLQHWADPTFESQIKERSEIVQAWLAKVCDQHASLGFKRRGRGLIWGLDVQQGDFAAKVIRHCFANGLLVEGAGADDQVLKLLPALTIEVPLLVEGLQILGSAIDAVAAERPPAVVLDLNAGQSSPAIVTSFSAGSIGQ
ncbi:MAG: diaminobutyrate--2-oxoglutarate transaminase [Rubripirellula sp.]